MNIFIFISMPISMLLDVSEHHNYFGVDENVGPVAISIKREKVNTNTKLSDPVVKQVIDINSKQGSEPASQQQYRVVVRTSEVSP